MLKNYLYVYDLLSGADSINEARAIQDELIALLARGGFSIRQWASNDERVINDLATMTLHANLIHDEDCSLKTLGITWSARDDQIRYTARSIKVSERATKRNILSEIAKIFDLLGLLGPIVLYAKKLMQDLWRCQIKWESVPQNISTAWLEYTQQLDLINQISFDRRILSGEYQDIQIHGFCDANNIGYSACVYVHSLGKGDEERIVRLLCAKSRVPPLKNDYYTATRTLRRSPASAIISRSHQGVRYSAGKDNILVAIQ